MNILEVQDTIDNFKDYQINWLRGHCDIELEDESEDVVVQFIRDTANTYVNGLYYKDSEKLAKVYQALNQITNMAKSDSIQDRCFRNAVKFIQNAIDGKKNDNYENIYDEDILAIFQTNNAS